MPIDPRDFLSGSSLSLDSSLVTASMTHALATSRLDPMKGIGIAVDTGLAMRSLFTPTTGPWELGLRHTLDAATSLTSLAQLRRPYDALSASSAYEPFKGTISSLAATSGLATSLSAVTIPSTHALTAFCGPELALGPTIALGGLDTIRAFQSVVPSLIASARCVYGLESSYRDLAYGGGAARLALDAGFTGIAGLDALTKGVSSLALSAQTSWERISANPSVLTATSLRIANTPAIEVYSATQAAGAITLPVEHFPPTDTEIEDVISGYDGSFEERLSACDQNLLEAYRGGVTAVERGGPDWRRQAMVSFRELSTHVLHKLAPDKAVVPLAARSELDEKGRPTRRARIRYIFSEVAGGELADFFESDLEAGVQLFEVLNAGTHRLGSRATPHQFRYIKARVVGLLGAMLEVRGY